MRYYFFETSMQIRNGKDTPTLRALPGQTFPDGTAVDDTINVQAPKEPGTSANGTRLEYPIGTRFCSSHLELVTSKAKVFYTVYDEENGELPGQKNPDFFPVTDDVNRFQYVNPAHRNDTMNAAYVRFMLLGSQESGEEEQKTQKKNPKNAFVGPFDNKGKARPIAPSYSQRYEDQMDTEPELIADWMRKIVNEMNIRTMARRPKIDLATRAKIEDLYKGGESVDTIASRTRFNELLKKEKIDSIGLQTLAKGPFDWYLDMILSEHQKCSDCSAVERNFNNTLDVEETAFLIGRQMDRLNGTTTDIKSDATIINNIRKAMEMGWSVDEILDPAVSTTQPDLVSLGNALATGIIPVPQKGNKNGVTLLDQIIKDKKLACPRAKDGFAVNKRDWYVFLRNIKVRENTLLTGPSGSGKTEIVKKLCEVMNLPLTIISMGSITDPTEQFVGKMDLDPATGGTKFDWADFALAIQRPGVILLDEINRIPRGGANAIFSCLDKTRTLFASSAKSTDQREIKVNPECVFFATANIGSSFTDANEIDEALKTRFLEKKLHYLDVNEEKAVLVARTGIEEEDASNIAIVARGIRDEFKKGVLQHNVSTRETIRAAELVRDGFDVEDSLEIAILDMYEEGSGLDDKTSEMARVKSIISSRFNKRKA